MKQKLIILFGGPEYLFEYRIYASFRQYFLDKYDFLFVGNSQEEAFLRERFRFFQIDFPFQSVYSWNTYTNISLSKEIWRTYEEIFIASEKYHLRRIKVFFARCGRTSGIRMQVLPTKEKWNAPILYWVYSTRLGTTLASWASKLLFKGK